MSDFDKEAEREKLREKYERDKEKREATEQMSELLLKGATMTNSHCGTCGDPIFRYEGQEFCSTCEEVVTDPEAAAEHEAAEHEAAEHDQNGAAAADDAADPSAAPEQSTEQASPEEPTSDSTPADASSTTGTDTPAAAAEPTAPEAGGTTGTPSDSPPSAGSGQSVPSADPGRTRDDTRSRVSTAPETVDGDDTSLASARTSLTRTVTKLAREAEASGDLERTRAYLAATEEAADALAAVKRADR